jgi:parallel beta-helix repeat protein
MVAVFASANAVLLTACGSHGTQGALVPSAPAALSNAAGVRGYVVRNLLDSGPGSLHDAIERANSRQGSNTQITFSVHGVIRLASDLPKILTRVTIDGTTAPNYVSHPVVAVNASGFAGFDFAAGSDNSKLLGLAIGGASGNGITLEATSIYVNFNYVGLDLKGERNANAGDRIYVTAQSSNDRIGENVSGASGVVGNIISGNTGNGISLHGSSKNAIADNWIGSNDKGKLAIANGSNGIWLTGGSNDNEIGGRRFTDSKTGDVNNPTGNKGKDVPVFVVPPDGNLVSGNVATAF